MDNNEERRCPRNCRMCNMAQQMYCAAQVTLSNMEAIQSLSERFDAFMAEIKGKEPIVPPVAQQGEAAQKVDSQDKTKKEQL